MARHMGGGTVIMGSASGIRKVRRPVQPRPIDPRTGRPLRRHMGGGTVILGSASGIRKMLRRT